MILELILLLGVVIAFVHIQRLKKKLNKLDQVVNALSLSISVIKEQTMSEGMSEALKNPSLATQRSASETPDLSSLTTPPAIIHAPGSSLDPIKTLPVLDRADQNKLNKPPLASPVLDTQRTTSVQSSDEKTPLLFERVWRWLISGNVPVKVGVLVLLVGVAALLRYLINQGLLNLPIEVRLGLVALGGMGGLVFGWTQRIRKPTFGLSVQGGSIGILLLTIFAASKLYALFPISLAFAMTVVLLMGAMVMAIKQESLTMAVLTFSAGFMAPIWLSTGSNNYVALFSYYAMLNLGIVIIAWFRSWPLLNVIGFVFTTVVASLWASSSYVADDFYVIQGFVWLFFIFYNLIPIFYGRRQPLSFQWNEVKTQVMESYWVLFLFVPTMVVAIWQQRLLASFSPWGDKDLLLALMYVGIASFYMVLASVFIRQPNYKIQGRIYAWMALGFATLAVPLAFSSDITSLIFLVEGTLLLGLSLRYKDVRFERSFSIVGFILQIIAALLSLEALSQVGTLGIRFMFDQSYLPTSALTHTNMHALLFALAGLVSALICYRKVLSKGRRSYEQEIITSGYVLATFFLVHGLLSDVASVYLSNIQIAFQVGFMLFIGLLLLTVWALQRWMHDLNLAKYLQYSLFVVVIPYVLSLAQVVFVRLTSYGVTVGSVSVWDGQGSYLAWLDLNFADYLLWAALVLAGAYLARLQKHTLNVLRYLSQVVWLSLVYIILQSIVYQLSLPVAMYSPDWWWVCTLIPFVLISVWIARPGLIKYSPLEGLLPGWLRVLQRMMGAVALLILLFTMSRPGSSMPLPWWIPLLNPFEMMVLVLIAIAYRLFALNLAPSVPSSRVIVKLSTYSLSFFILLFINMSVLRALWHWFLYDDVHYLSHGMFSLPVTQAVLSIFWSVMGVMYWLIGSKKNDRTLWAIGAFLIGMVLLKLLLNDRQYLSDLSGIFTFIAYGVLCMVIGYFVPPPGLNKKEA